MALLFSNNNQLQLVPTANLFFGKYQYSVLFDMAEAWVLRYSMQHDEIDSRLDQQQTWRESMKDRWPHSTMSKYHSSITSEVRQQLHAMSDRIQSITVDYKMIVEHNSLRLYTNSVDLLKEIDQHPNLQQKKFRQAQINCPPNTIMLKNPQHQYRSFLREIRMTSDEKEALRTFLSFRPDIRLGPGLAQWLQAGFSSYISRYTRNYFFIDYDHPNWSTMLALVCPSLIRKTVRILAK
jgi:hypothetical protein